MSSTSYQRSHSVCCRAISFRKKMRGFDPQEVQSFQRLVSEEYEQIFAENTVKQADDILALVESEVEL